jgi:uncharacterized membrane protein (DUF373 family)
MWPQVYDPFNSAVRSTLVAAIPVVVMLAALAFFILMTLQAYMHPFTLLAK